MAVLMREMVGETLRQQRLSFGLTLRDVSSAARVSLGYLSEVERGQKEASSELLNAICGALEMPLADLLRLVAERAEAAGAVVDFPVPNTRIAA